LFIMHAFQTQEVCNPFLCFRWFWLETGRPKEAFLFRVNTNIVMVLWIVVRLLFGSYVLYLYLSTLPERYVREAKFWPIHALASVFQLLQYYWAAGFFRSSTKPKTSE